MTVFRLLFRSAPPRRRLSTLSGVALLAALAAAAGSVSATETTTCELTFEAADWSTQYRAARGAGIVRCADGRSLPVRVSIKGSDRALRISAGAASFSGVRDPRDVIGAYAADGHDAGPHRSMRKGGVQLRVTATGEWWQQGGRPDSLVIATR